MSDVFGEGEADHQQWDDGQLSFDIVFTQPNETLTNLNDIKSSVSSAFTSWAGQSYIWHGGRGPSISFHESATSAATQAPVLHGTFSFGDNIDDEWLVVSLLVELTRRFADLGAVLSCNDNDGDFLLIEIADTLPDYIDPDDSINRTFVINGELHHIPPCSAEVPELMRAAELSNTSCLVPSAIHAYRHKDAIKLPHSCQIALESRLKDYPKRAIECMHVARCYVLEGVARLLCRDPQLISAAIDAFYNRSTEDVVAASNMLVFKPESKMVEMSVPMTRNLYSKLAQQQFVPPKRYRNILPPEIVAKLADKSAISSDLLADGVADGSRKGVDDRVRAYVLGAKIVAGFEMLLHDKAAQRQLNAAIHNEVADTLSSADFRRFISSLRSRGFFAACKTEAEVVSRTEEARQYFLKNTATNSETNSDPTTAKVTDTIVQYVRGDAALRACLAGSDAGAATEPHLYSWPPNRDRDDGLSWIEEAHTAQGFFDKVMSGKEMEPGSEMDGHLAPLQKILQQLNTFVDKPSDYRGVDLEAEEAGSNDSDEDDIDESDEKQASTGSVARPSQQGDMEADVSQPWLHLPKGYMLTVDDVYQALRGECDTTPVALPPVSTRQWQVEKSSLHELMRSADEEIAHALHSTFETAGKDAGPMTEEDVKFNLLANLSRSVSSQAGAAGPSSNLLSTLKAEIPREWWTAHLSDTEQGPSGAASHK